MSRRWIAVSLVGAALTGIVTLVGCTCGIGAYLGVGWILFLPILLMVSGTVAAFLSWSFSIPHPSRPALLAAVLGVPFFLTGWFAGTEIRLVRCRTLARRAEPLIRAIEEHRRDQGRWPPTLSDVKGWDRLVASAGLSVQQRELSRDGFDTSGIGNADLTFYIGREEYVAVIPVERIVPMSFTSFKILLRSNRSNTWEEDRFTWILAGLREAR